MKSEFQKGMSIGVIFGTLLGIIIVSVLFLVFWILPDNNFYYFLLVNERFIMVIFLTIGIIVSFGILGVIVIIYLLLRGIR